MDSSDLSPAAFTPKSTAHPETTAIVSSRVDRKMLTFPEKLMDVIDCGIFKDAITWTPDGKAFCIISKLFVDKVLNGHFQGSRFGSFKRKLFRYGFRKRSCSPGRSTILVYQHDLFLRGKPELLEFITGGKQRESDAKTGKLAFSSTLQVPKSSVDLSQDEASAFRFSDRSSQIVPQLSHSGHQVQLAQMCHLRRLMELQHLCNSPSSTAQINSAGTVDCKPQKVLSHIFSECAYPVLKPAPTVSSVITSPAADCDLLSVRDHILSQLNYKRQLDLYRQLVTALPAYQVCGTQQGHSNASASIAEPQPFLPQIKPPYSLNHPTSQDNILPWGMLIKSGGPLPN